MINQDKIKALQIKIRSNKDKLSIEKDYRKRAELRLKIQIDELKIKLEQLR